MEYKHLERIQLLMSLRSTTSYSLEPGGRGVDIVDYQNAAAALALVGSKCEPSTKLIADVYCVECKNNYLTLRHELHKAMIRLLKADGKKLDHALAIVDVGMGQVYHGKLKTAEKCGELMGITARAYDKTWRAYVEKTVELLHRNLFDANLVAGDYFYNERYGIDNQSKNVV